MDINKTNKAKKTLLIVAPGISEEDVGEVFSGYKWVQGLSEYFDITILALERHNKPNIRFGDINAKIIKFKEIPFFHRFERFNSMAKPWYLKFYMDVKKWLSEQKKNGVAFDWYHQITPQAMRYPSPLSAIKVKYSLGPVAGSLPNPDAFQDELGTMPWYMKFRDLDLLRFKYDPVLRASYQNASFVIAGAEYVKERLTEEVGLDAQNILVLNEQGIDSINDNKIKKIDEGSVIKLLFVGRIVRTKGVRDLVRAISQLPGDINIQLDVIGAGTDLQSCIDEAGTLGVSDKIKFHGKINRAEIDSYYEKADIFVFPSFREPMGGVVIEAMSFGLPMIVANYGGPGSMVKNKFGIKLDLISPEQYVKDIKDAIILLASDASLRLRMGEEAKHHCADTYIWDNKMKTVSNIFENKINAYKG